MADEFGLYLVFTDSVAGYERCTEAAVEAGVRYVQLRMKHRAGAEILTMAQRLQRITAGTSTRFIVNDEVEIARECGADGVDLGQVDMALDDGRWPEPGKLVGLSTHGEEHEAAARKLAPDYIGVGPVYPTPTKDKPDPALGPGARWEHHPEFAAHLCRHWRHQRGEPRRRTGGRNREFLRRSRRHPAVQPQGRDSSFAAPLGPVVGIGKQDTLPRPCRTVRQTASMGSRTGSVRTCQYSYIVRITGAATSCLC